MNFKNVYLYDQNNSLYASKNHPIFLNEEYNELDTDYERIKFIMERVIEQREKK